MIKGIFYTADALQSKFKSIEVISNNLSNVNTAGFKRQQVFSEILKENGDKTVRQDTDFSQGELMETGGTLDLAIQGDGFFTLKTQNGTELTRKGSFKIDDDGFLVNENNDKVMGKGGEINLLEYRFTGADKITVSKEGIIKVDDTEVDRLLISGRNSDMTMDRMDGLNFNADTSTAPGQFSIFQGYLEGSNVNPLQEMENMISENKEYESAYKIMGSLDQSLRQANEIGKV